MERKIPIKHSALSQGLYNFLNEIDLNTINCNMESPEDTQLAILTFPSNWDLHFHDWFQENYSVQNKEKLEILAE